MTFTATGNNTCVWGSKKTAYNEAEDNIDLTNYDSSLVYAPDTAPGTGGTVTIGDTALLSGVSYYITNKNSNLVLDLTDGSTTTGTNIQQWAKLGGAAQEWRIVSAENGYCRILSMADESKCMAVAENTATDGINIELQTYSGADNQLWKLVQDGSYYGIVSKCSDDKAGLDVYDWSTENGGNLNQWEFWGGDCQLWKIAPVYPLVNDGSYTVRNVNSGLYMANADGNVLQSGTQAWTFQRAEDGTYTVLSADGKALTVENGSAENGANLLLSTPDGSASQKFSLRCNKDGSYSLLTAASGFTACADVFEISTEDGANINQWEYWGGDGQRFVLEPAASEQGTEQPTEKIKGDVDANGVFNLLDVVMMQKYILKAGQLNDYAMGDLYEDGVLDVFDLVMMKRLLLAQ